MNDESTGIAGWLLADLVLVLAIVFLAFAAAAVSGDSDAAPAASAEATPAAPIILDIGCLSAESDGRTEVECEPTLGGGKADSFRWEVDRGHARSDAGGDSFLARFGDAGAVRLTVSNAGGEHSAAYPVLPPTTPTAAFGDNATATEVYTDSVTEDVAGGILTVPVTISHLPQVETTFAIEVLTVSSATEDADYRIVPKSVTFGPSDTSLTKDLSIAITDDGAVEPDETIRLRIIAPAGDPTAARPATPGAAQAIITIAGEGPPPTPTAAFGDSATATQAYTDSVAEDVAGGTLTVPVTVSHLPQAETTFAVEVLATSSATEHADYRITPKSVTFSPSDTSLTKDLSIAITDDGVVEDAETIRLRIAPAGDPGTAARATPGGAQAIITITGDGAPSAEATPVEAPLILDIGCTAAESDGPTQVECEPALAGGAVDSYEWVAERGQARGPRLDSTFAASFGGAGAVRLTVSNAGGGHSAAYPVLPPPPVSANLVLEDFRFDQIVLCGAVPNQVDWQQIAAGRVRQDVSKAEELGGEWCEGGEDGDGGALAFLRAKQQEGFRIGMVETFSNLNNTTSTELSARVNAAFYAGLRDAAADWLPPDADLADIFVDCSPRERWFARYFSRGDLDEGEVRINIFFVRRNNDITCP